MTAALELQAAIVATLRQSSMIQALLGGMHVYDDVPDRQRPPYISIADVTSIDWSTGDLEGEEHFVEIAAWSRGEGRKLAVELAGAVKQVLCLSATQAGLALPGHVLVNLTHEETRSTPAGDDAHFSAVVLFRAITEPRAD